jgi:hypothetical protein
MKSFSLSGIIAFSLPDAAPLEWRTFTNLHHYQGGGPGPIGDMFMSFGGSSNGSGHEGVKKGGWGGGRREREKGRWSPCGRSGEAGGGEPHHDYCYCQ